MAIITFGWQPPNFKMVQTQGTLELSDNASSFKYTNIAQTNAYNKIDKLSLTVINPNLTKKEYFSNLNLIIDSNYAGASSGHYEDTIFKIPLNVSGEYSFELAVTYTYYHTSGTHIEHTTITEKYSCYIYVNPGGSKELKPYSLGDAIRRLLDLTPTRTTNEQNKYSFDPIQLAEYDKEESPEFAFTGHTLFEALLIIAQYKGAFPVLKDGVISFRKLWSGERYSDSELPPPIDDVSSSDINQYCTYLDTEVQNLVGINDSQAGSIVEPYAGGYKTTRAGNGSEISQDTAVISTDYNQYLHIKEEIGYIGGVVPDNNDITPYIYESGDYNALSEMTGAYPNSKAYALQWAQMSKNITELAHRVKSSSSIAQAFKEPAIANIIQAKTGESYDTGFVDFLRKLLNLENGNSFADLMFRTTYIPVINSRIKQYKDYFGEFHHDGSLKYNQTAELVDSELYGEHLKQLIRKLGNATKRKTYIFDRIDDIPKVGDLVENYSVYDIQMSIRENEVVATLSFVKYAELSQYVGVKNPWKDSDVSTDKCYNRQVSLNEFLLLTHDSNKLSTSNSLTELGLVFLLPGSHSELFKSLPLTCVQGTGYMSDGSELNTVLLPVVSLAVGNSLLFQWGYQNNYSAGYMSESAPDGATSVLSGTKYNRAQKAVKYTDSSGKMETYDFSLMSSGPIVDDGLIWVEGADREWKPSIITYPGNVTFEIKNLAYVYVNLSEKYPFDTTVRFLVQNGNGKEKDYEIIVRANRTSNYKVIVDPVPPLSTVTLISASCYDTGGYEWYTEQNDIAKAIGNSLPLKPSQLRLKSDFSEWKGADFISVENLLVQKNSSEALTFSVQLHYCSDNENFIVGSGLTNFCPLIGGSVEEVALYGFPERINIFNRRISVANATLLALPDIQKEAGKISIILPADINNYQAWAYVGKDKNGNYQIIFGENKDLNGSAFETELYLLPMHKLEDFI